jgi:CheY-like chemotaxis protein
MQKLIRFLAIDVKSRHDAQEIWPLIEHVSMTRPSSGKSQGAFWNEMDFQIIEAEDGEKALEACRRRLPDVIPLDWNMPIMDGYEFLGNLRRMPGGDAPKVVFCTTENGIDHIARALNAGGPRHEY